MNYFDLIKRTAIYLKYKEPTVFTDNKIHITEIKYKLNSVLKEICSAYTWNFRRKNTTLNITTDQAEYDFSGEIESIKIQGENNSLIKIYEEDLKNYSNLNNKPEYYTQRNEKIIIYPTPNNTYTLDIKYFTYNFATDSTGTTEKQEMELEEDLSIIPLRFREVLIFGTCKDFKSDVTKGKYIHFNSKYTNILNQMKKASRNDVNAVPRLQADFVNFSSSDLITKFYKSF